MNWHWEVMIDPIVRYSLYFRDPRDVWLGYVKGINDVGLIVAREIDGFVPQRLFFPWSSVAFINVDLHQIWLST